MQRMWESLQLPVRPYGPQENSGGEKAFERNECGKTSGSTHLPEHQRTRTGEKPDDFHTRENPYGCDERGRPVHRVQRRVLLFARRAPGGAPARARGESRLRAAAAGRGSAEAPPYRTSGNPRRSEAPRVGRVRKGLRRERLPPPSPESSYETGAFQMERPRGSRSHPTPAASH